MISRTALFSLALALLVGICTWPGIFDVDDTRPIKEQIEEAADNARIGHLTLQNRKACRYLQPGDIVSYDNRLWSVRSTDFYGMQIRNLNYDQITLSPSDDLQMSPERFEYVYKLGTKEWSLASCLLALQGLPKFNKK